MRKNVENIKNHAVMSIKAWHVTDDDDDVVLSCRCFSLVLLLVPHFVLLIPLSLFIYLWSLSVRTFILNPFLRRRDNANQNKSEQIFEFH